ncbi:chlamydia polymorphic membrane middle domain protein, partial [Chlamydia psittaci 02DC21]
MYFLCGVRRR